MTTNPEAGYFTRPITGDFDMRNPDRGHYILAFALIAAVFGLILAAGFARAADTPKDPTPFHMAIGLSVTGPDGKDVPVYFGVVKKGGFATEEECMGKKGVDDPKFHALIKKLSEAVSERIGGATVKAVAGCVDITKLPPPEPMQPAAPTTPADDGQPKIEKL